MRYLWVTLLVCAIESAAETVTTLIDNGDPMQRVDLVVLGDGFTASEMDAFRMHAAEAADGFLADPPYRNYAPFFNVHTIEVVSKESGADHPERESYKDTALGATYGCGGVQRLICIDYEAVGEVLDRSVELATRDIVMVLVNDTEAGGSGGLYFVSSISGDLVESMLHELGHTFARLADEYEDERLCGLYGPAAPWPNVTQQTNREEIKWNVGGGPPTGWIEGSTDVPTTTTTPAEVGLYEGAFYCSEGIYRPTYASKMRTLGQPWDAVNEEQIVKSIYGLVSAVEFAEPPPGEIDVGNHGLLKFASTVVRPVPSTTDVTWFLDDQPIGRSDEMYLDLSTVGEGEHVVRLEVTDNTVKVRNDPESLLKDSRSWRLNAFADEDGDGLPTSYELEHGLDPNDPGDANQDPDGDGLTNLQEFVARTDPSIADSDQDGANDGEEVADGYDPLSADNCPQWACGGSRVVRLLTRGVLVPSDQSDSPAESPRVNTAVPPPD